MIQLRRYTLEDCKMLYDWRVHPSVRKFSFNSEIFSYKSHEKWFQKLIICNDKIGLIMEDEGKSVGQIRFEPGEFENSVKIAIAVSPNEMGHGYGTKLLEEGCKYPEIIEKYKFLIGEVKTVNKSSERIFEKNQFEKIGVFSKNHFDISYWVKPTKVEYDINPLKTFVNSKLF